MATRKKLAGRLGGLLALMGLVACSPAGDAKPTAKKKSGAATAAAARSRRPVRGCATRTIPSAPTITT